MFDAIPKEFLIFAVVSVLTYLMAWYYTRPEGKQKDERNRTHYIVGGLLAGALAVMIWQNNGEDSAELLTTSFDAN